MAVKPPLIHVEVADLPALRLTEAMREMLLEPVDRTRGGDDVVCYTPRRTNYALLHRKLIDASNRITPLGRGVVAALKRRAQARREFGL